ncbi:hypothetical protein FSP39_001617 [Pinctada imbricata]|uniref:EGF-like domain-containing protein n=1 Tax=Pinctada imbricata TaxID=66713 RepID=A0AA88YG23_PINIB|nr:hypothetical protein FSP39_001617 [Pinctada imbricata]
MRWKLAYMCCFLYIVLIISLDSQPVQQGMDRRKDLEKGQKSVWEFSQFFHRWNIGLSQSKLKTSVSAAAATKQMRTVMGMFSKFTAAAAGILGTIGALFSFALLFVPKTDSPELQQMKRTYSVMNERLNSISSSIDELKNIIPLENQKAVYKDHELRIKAAYSAFTMCQDMIIDAQCTTEQECFRKRTIIAGNFRNDLDISTHVYAVAKGSVDDGVFGRSLLDLLKESSKCDLSQINSITTGIAMLIFKGMVVVSFKNRISLPDYDDSNDAEYLSSALTNLEAKRQEIEKSCLKDVDIFMMNDLQNSKSKMSADTQRTNEAILPFFKAKYFWNDWFVASFVSEKDPENWPRDSILGNLHVKSEQHNVHTIAWPIYKDPVNAFSIKRTHLIQIYLQQNGSMINMVNKISESPYIRNQIKSLYSIFASQNFIISYYRENGEMNHTYSTSSNANPNSYSLRQGNYLLTYFNVSAEPFACNLDCHGQGECILYPHSNQMFCRCHPGFFGESCNETRNSEQMKRDIGKLMSTTLKLPSISSLKFQLEDSIALLQMSFENMSDAFSNIENMINNKFKSFGSLMARIEEWNQVRAQYQDSVQKISYLANFYHGNLRLSNWNMTLMSNILGKIPAGRMSPCRRRQEIASMLDPLTLRKWISDINYLIIGRNDNFLTQHRPLIFIVMDKMKDRVCYPDYKAKIDLAFSQLVALQLQGYMVWEMVLVFLGLETTPLVASYKQVIAKQNETLRNMTCTANIPNSRNFVSCLGGFFIHPKLDVDVVCVEQFYPREQKRLWVQSVESFSSQYTVLAWGVSKLIGAPRVYPRYTHGIDAWKQAQNKLREMQFLTVKFPERLFPEEVRIYEVFNAGAVKKIEVLRPDSKWMTIWETSIVRDIKHSRIFSPYFKTLPVLVDTINVTIDPRKANDYVAIDAMMMIGRPQQNDEHFLWNAAIGNIPSSPAYSVFISQLIRYARASTKYTDFVLRARRLSDKLLSQGYVCDRLTSSLRKFYGRYGELVIHYDVPLSSMVDDILS